MATIRKRPWTNKKTGAVKTCWQVDYKDHGGTRRHAQFEKKKDAQAHLAKVQNELTTGVHVAPTDDITVKALCDLYLKNAESRRSDGRIGGSRYVGLRAGVARAILPFWGSRKLASITSGDVEAWYEWMRKDRKMKPASARARVEILRLMEVFAQRKGLMKAGAVGVAKRELGVSPRERIRTFTFDQVVHLLSTAARNPPPAWRKRNAALSVCFINLAAFCGLRFGEIAGLKRENFDAEARVVRVRHSMSSVDGLKGPKTRAGIRDVPIPQHIAEIVSAFIGQFQVANPDDLIFTARNGAPLLLSNFHINYWKPLQVQAGLVPAGLRRQSRAFGPPPEASGNDEASGVETRRFHFHALRHFAASWMIHNGFSLVETASILGHETFDMTLQTYAHSIVGGTRRHELTDRMAEPLLLAVSALDATPMQPCV